MRKTNINWKEREKEIFVLIFKFSSKKYIKLKIIFRILHRSRSQFLGSLNDLKEKKKKKIDSIW